MIKALDLFCGAGGASMGLHRAGFDVTGVDLYSQPRYPFKFIQADALTFDLGRYDFYWASPPCQRYSNAQRIQNYDHPDLIEPIRQKLVATWRSFVIENVLGAPLNRPITLCGEMFGLRTYRHRLFEANFALLPPRKCKHDWPNAKMGRPVKEKEFIQVVGNFSNVALGREAMQIDWMNRNELREAIPPAYSEYIAKQWLSQK